MDGLRVLRWRKPYGKWTKEKLRPKALKAASLATHFALGLVTGCVRLPEGIAPFGVAMTARCGGGTGGAACLLGAACGYLLSGGVRWCLRYEASLLLVFTAAFLLRGKRIQRRAWFMPCVSAVSMAFTGALNGGRTVWSLPGGVVVFTEAMLTGMGCYLFLMALTSVPTERESDEMRRDAGGMLLLCCLLMALSRIRFGNVLCLGRTAAVLTVLTAAFTSGASAGAAMGVAAGLAVDVAGSGDPFFALCYGFAGLTAGALKSKGRVMSTITFVCTNALGVFQHWPDVEMAALYEVFAASVIFLLLPAGVLTTAAVTLQRPGTGAGEAEMRRYTASRTAALAEAFRAMYETVNRSAEEPEETDYAGIYDRAAESVCTACPRKNDCWQENYRETLRLLENTSRAMESKSHLEREDVHADFRERCPSHERFLHALNGELRTVVYRRRLRNRQAESTAALWEQYRCAAGVLTAVAEELRYSVGADALAERRLLRFLNSREIDGTVAAFRTKSGRLRVTVESPRLQLLLRSPDYMDRISETLGCRMCRPTGENRRDDRLVLLEAEPLAVSVGVAAMKKAGEMVSGDRGTYFKTDEGILCVLLSDGMGTGETAARDSVSVVQILERFLRSGVEPAAAMRMLNSVLLLQSGNAWGYATVDLMCIDLFSGQTGVYKYGAAPTYVRTGKVVRRLRGQSMAAGLLSGEGESPDEVRMQLRPGCLALVASDGVVDGENDGWLRKLLSEYCGGDTRELARQVLRQSTEAGNVDDDRTVLTILVEARR